MRRLPALGRWGWVVVGIALGALPAAAQAPRLPPKVISWAQPTTVGASAAFGILGEVARPGVYAAPNGPVTLQELIRQAGGLTARGSASVRIVRQARTAQTVFYSPTGHDLLLPHDVAVVDDLGERHPQSTDAAPTSPPGVWVCFVGVADRPVIVPLRPEEAQYSTVMRMLGQSEKLAQSEALRLTLPPSAPWPASAAAAIPRGAVLTFDRRYLVTQNLPQFPEVIPFATASAPQAQPTTAPSDAPSAAAPPSVPANTDAEWSASLASQSRSPVEAIPVPFPAPPSDETAVDTASLPAPGSRLQQQLAAPMPATRAPRRTVDPKLAADNSAEILPDIDDDSDFDAEAATPPGFSLWQMLGIGGTVASLIGIAIATRRFLDRSEPPSPRSFGARAPLPPPPTPLTSAEIAASQRRFEIPPPQPAMQPPSTPLEDEPSDLDELLRGDLTIVTEPIVFPPQFPLQRQHDALDAMLRVDIAERRLVPAPHAAFREPIARGVAREDLPASAIPRPHFSQSRQPKSSQTDVAPAAPAPASRPLVAARPVLAAGTPLERALSQLQGGPHA